MLRFIYLINIFSFGFIGTLSSLNAELANIAIYQKVFVTSTIMQLTGSFWLTIAALSFLGLLFPKKFFLFLTAQALFQFIWLIINFILLRNNIPWGLNIFFIIWIIIFTLTVFKNNLYSLKNI